MARMERAFPALRETVKYFTALSTHASYGLIVSHLVNHKAVTVYVNRAFCRMVGYAPSEIKTIDTDAFFRPCDLPLQHRRYFRGLKKGVPFSRYETILVKKDKAEIPVEVTEIRTTWNGRPANLLTIVNLSSIKKTEAIKQEQENRYKALAESSPDMIYLISQSGRVLYVNPRAAAYLRRSKQQICGMELRAVFPPEIAARYLRSIRSVFRTGKPLFAPVESLPGSTIRIETQLIPMRAADGRITSVMGVSRDVTRQYRAEKATKASADLFRLLIANSFDGINICSFDPATWRRRLISCNSRYVKMSGYSLNALKQARDLNELTTPHAPRREWKRHKRFIIQGIPFTGVTSWNRPDGQPNAYEWTALPFRKDGRYFILGIDHNITKRQADETALRLSEEKFAKAFIASPNVMVVNTIKEGRVLDVNIAAQRLSGYTRRELIGRRVDDLKIWRDMADRQRMLRTLRRKGAVRDMECQLQNKAGKPLLVSLSAQPIEIQNDRCLLAIMRDITQERQLQQALKTSETKFAKAFKASPDMITITTLNDGRFIDVNSAFLRTLGYRYSEIIGKRSEELDIWSSPKERWRWLSELRHTGHLRDFQLQYRQRRGPQRWVSISAEFITIDNQPCILSVIRDITDHKRLDIERQRLTARIQEAQENERQNISTTLHDHLGQLLTMAKMETHSIRPSDDDSRRCQANAAKHIHEALASIRSMAMMLRTPILDDLGLAMAMKALVEDVARAYHLRATLTHRGQLPVLSMQQKVCLYRVLQEALTNAARHSGSKRIWVTLKADAAKVSVQIKDNGCGFNQAHLQTNHGLGLAGMRERLVQYGGHLNIASRPHQGTVLTAVCPCHLPPTELPHD